ncbi:quercetin dioxygenase-like cupin family protein [Oxalobacteraceae bacterium GrIS 1.11]
MAEATFPAPVFSSKDFAKVPSQLTPDQPERLLHADVLNADAGDSSAFSNERQHLVRMVDLPSKIISMTLGGLKPGQSTRLHRHNYETIIYVLSGFGHSLIGGREVQWCAGDAFYVPVWAWHQHFNDSDSEQAQYIACENAPMLQNLGLALREEACNANF